MEDSNKKPASAPHAVPEHIDDLEQLTNWLSNYGKPALIGLVVAIVVLLGVTIWRNQMAEKNQAAVEALFQGRAPEEFRQMALADEKAPTAPLALATAAAEFYAMGRYDEALSSYERFLSLFPDHLFAKDAAIGIAASLEALDDFATASQSYQAFVVANPQSPLLPQAVLGAGRCLEQLGQFDEARALFDEFIVAHPDSSWTPQIESGILFLGKAERAWQTTMAAPVPLVTDDAESVVVFDSSVDPVVVDEAIPPPADEPADEQPI